MLLTKEALNLHYALRLQIKIQNMNIREVKNTTKEKSNNGKTIILCISFLGPSNKRPLTSCLRQQMVIVSQFCRPEVWYEGVGKDHIILEVSREVCVLGLSPSCQGPWAYKWQSYTCIFLHCILPLHACLFPIFSLL